MITVVTCFYILSSKFNVDTYIKWIKNFLNISNKVNIIIYTNNRTLNLIYQLVLNKENIKIIIKELENFYTYHHKTKWINNHQKNVQLNKKISWEVNLLWNEKVAFIKDATKYNDSEWYIWCDIGYFRTEHPGDLTTTNIAKWPNITKVSNFNKNKIYYAQVAENLDSIIKNINNKNKFNLPKIPIPANSITVAGGFFVINKQKINWWFQEYYQKIDLYFTHNQLIKDDQIIIIDCIANNIDEFYLIKETNNKFNEWFVFQRFLS